MDNNSKNNTKMILEKSTIPAPNTTFSKKDSHKFRSVLNPSLLSSKQPDSLAKNIFPDSLKHPPIPPQISLQPSSDLMPSVHLAVKPKIQDQSNKIATLSSEIKQNKVSDLIQAKQLLPNLPPYQKKILSTCDSVSISKIKDELPSVNSGYLVVPSTDARQKKTVVVPSSSAAVKQQPSTSLITPLKSSSKSSTLESDSNSEGETLSIKISQDKSQTQIEIRETKRSPLASLPTTATIINKRLTPLKVCTIPDEVLEPAVKVSATKSPPPKLTKSLITPPSIKIYKSNVIRPKSKPKVLLSKPGLLQTIVKSLKRKPSNLKSVRKSTSEFLKKSFKKTSSPTQVKKFPSKFSTPSLPSPPHVSSFVQVKKEDIKMRAQPIKVLPKQMMEKPSSLLFKPDKIKSEKTISEHSSTIATEMDKITVVREIHKKSLSEPNVQRIRAKIVQKIKPKRKRQDERQNFLNDCVVYTMSQMLAVTILVLLGTWLMQYFSGFGYQTPRMVFNLHPMLMIFGVIYIMANSLLFLMSKKMSKILRLALLFVMILLVTLATLATIYWHIKTGIPHMFTLHSWFGMATLIMLIMYLVGNSYLYFLPHDERCHHHRSSDQRLSLLNLRLFGIATLIVASITSLLGLNQLETFRSSQLYLNSNTYILRLLVNVIAIFLVMFVVFMIYLVVRRQYRSKEHEEYEEQIQMAVDQAMEQMEANGVFNSPSNKETDVYISSSPSDHKQRKRKGRSKSPRISV